MTSMWYDEWLTVLFWQFANSISLQIVEIVLLQSDLPHTFPVPLIKLGGKRINSLNINANPGLFAFGPLKYQAQML